MKTIELYSYDELSAEAKKYVKENHYNLLRKPHIRATKAVREYLKPFNLKLFDEERYSEWFLETGLAYCIRIDDLVKFSTDKQENSEGYLTIKHKYQEINKEAFKIYRKIFDAEKETLLQDKFVVKQFKDRLFFKNGILFQQDAAMIISERL